jgi:uncharacterized protein (DUF433 family)
MTDYVFYVPGKPGIVDLAITVDGVMRGAYGRKTLQELAAEYPEVALGTLDEVEKASEAMFRSPPIEISEERWCEMLEVLPPVGWIRGSAGESFKLSERTYGRITAIFCRIEERYFELSDDIRMPHDEIVAACKAVITCRRMTCCVCGDDAGRWHQHWNRDDGYGVCVKCVDWLRSRGESEATILDHYGREGINWGAKDG